MRLAFLVVICVWPVLAVAEMGSVLNRGVESSRVAILPASMGQRLSKSGSSLFAGSQKGSMFAPYPVRLPPLPAATPIPSDSSPVDRIRNVIQRAESPRAGYDAVQHGARVKHRKKPTQMTSGEIMDWIAATSGQPHAIGRYQFIPSTLRRVVAKVGARRSDRFTPALQDKLADVLLEDAGYSRFMAGQLSQRKFMDNLAAIWAGLPASNGKSKYHGYAGNRATISLAYFRSEIAKISPG